MLERKKECQRDIGIARVRFRTRQRDTGSVKEIKGVSERYRECQREI